MAISEVDASGLEALSASGNAQIIDVRSDGEVARGMIDGAKHMALSTLPARLGELDRTRPVVVYCQVGARSTQACQFLAAQGFEQVTNLRGGLTAWLNSGRAVNG